MRTVSHFLLWYLRLVGPETQTTQAERECLARHAEHRRRLVEIGVWHGVTTRRLRSVMAADGVLLAIDPYPVGRLGLSLHQIVAHCEVNRVGRGRVQWIRSTGVDAARDYAARGGEPVDLVFIDGDHSYDAVRGDWESWSPLVETGGVVALHDSRSSSTRRIDDAGSVLYTQNIISKDPIFALIETVDTLTVFQRR